MLQRPRRLKMLKNIAARLMAVTVVVVVVIMMETIDWCSGQGDAEGLET